MGGAQLLLSAGIAGPVILQDGNIGDGIPVQLKYAITLLFIIHHDKHQGICHGSLIFIPNGILVATGIRSHKKIGFHRMAEHIGPASQCNLRGILRKLDPFLGLCTGCRFSSLGILHIHISYQKENGNNQRRCQQDLCHCMNSFSVIFHSIPPRLVHHSSLCIRCRPWKL